MKNYLACFAASAGLLLIVAPVRATQLFSDDFSYPDGELRTVGSAKWTRSSGTSNDLNVSATRVVINDTAADDATAALSSSVASGAVYASFQYTPDSADRSTSTTGSEYFLSFGDTGGTSTLMGRVFPAIPSGTVSPNIRLGVSNITGSANVFFPTDIAPNIAHLVVIKYDFTSKQTTLWVDPVDESSASVTATDAVTTSGTVDKIGLRQPSGAAMGDGFVDNLGVGTTFADSIVPEPSSLGVMLGAAGLLLRRRRRA